jgi:hypothetical protein
MPREMKREKEKERLTGEKKFGLVKKREISPELRAKLSGKEGKVRASRLREVLAKRRTNERAEPSLTPEEKQRLRNNFLTGSNKRHVVKGPDGKFVEFTDRGLVEVKPEEVVEAGKSLKISREDLAAAVKRVKWKQGVEDVRQARQKRLRELINKKKS